MHIDFHESFLPSYIPRAIVEFCLQEHISEDVIFAQLELCIQQLRDPHFKLTYSEMSILVGNCLSALDLNQLSIKVGQHIQLQDLGLVGQLLQHCPTLKDALYVLERYSVLIDPALWFKVEKDQDYFVIRYRKMIPLGDIYQYSQEVISILLIRLLSQLFDIENLQLHFEFSIPSHAKQLHFLPCSISWNQPETQLIIHDPKHSSNIGQAVSSNSSSEFLQLKQQAESQFKDFFRVKKYWIFRVLSLIHSHLHQPLKAEDLAALLFTSRSTFFRKLYDYHTNYEDLIQQVRMDFASKYLLQNKGTVSHLAYTLGFSHPSNFIKSFQDYFGMPPKQWQNSQFETIALLD